MNVCNRFLDLNKDNYVTGEPNVSVFFGLVTDGALDHSCLTLFGKLGVGEGGRAERAEG